MGDKKGVDSKSFMDQTTITSVEFGEECSFVGDSAFARCTSLSGINTDNVVETIDGNAFAGCTSLNEVKFIEVTSIGANAFAGCENLNYIGIPICKEIKDGAFQNCQNLEYVEKQNQPKKEAYIYNSAFQNCSKLYKIYLDDCETIGDNAFENCTKLSGNLNLNRCTSIGKEAFKNCSKIEKLTLENCAKIGSDTFMNCDKLQHVYIKNPMEIKCRLDNATVFYTENNEVIPGILFYFNSDTYAFYTNESNARKLNWFPYIDYMVRMVEPNQVIYTSNDGKIIEEIVDNTISEHTYNGKYGIITFKMDIESMPKKIFNGLDRLTSIDIPSKCKHIGESIFEGCTNLKSIKPSDVLETIGNYAFKNCESLTSFTIPTSVYVLGEGAFAGCTNLEKFEGSDVFVKYDGKAIVCDGTLICVLPKDDRDRNSLIYNINEIDEAITKLGEFCFSGCENMVRVNIPANISKINNSAFENCTSLYEIHFSGSTPPEIGDNVFNGISEDYKIFVPEEHFLKYFEKWSDKNFISHVYPKPVDNGIIYYGDTLNLPNQQSIKYADETYYKITNVDTNFTESYFTGQENITKVILGESISKIGKEAFKGCTKLEYIYLSDSITEFNNQCFYNCSSLKKIHIPIGLKDNSFIVENWGSNITYSTRDVNINISTLNDYFGSETFYGCTNLTEFGTYHKGYVTKDKRCYVYNSDLKFFAQGGILEYEIPNDINITSINKYAFKGSGISQITLNENIKKIGEYAFANCVELQNIINWYNIKTISKGAFMECNQLGALELPNKLEVIEENAFNGCVLMYLDDYIPETVTFIGNGAFKNCENFIILKSGEPGRTPLELKNITRINKSSFEGCTSLKEVIINNEILTINDSAFAGCTSLEKVSLYEGSSLTSINANAFKGCKKLKSITLTDKITEIGDSAFVGCVSLKRVELPSKLVRLSHNCLATGSDIEITIPTDLINPPGFNNLSATEPFGPPQTNSNTVKIRIPFQLECTYVNNLLWTPYKYQFVPYGEMGYLEDYLTVSVDPDGIHLNFIKNGNIPFRWVGYSIGYTMFKKNASNNEIYQARSFFNLTQEMSDINRMPYRFTIKSGNSYYDDIRLTGNYFIKLQSSIKLSIDPAQPDDEKYKVQLKASDIPIVLSSTPV